MLLNVYVAEKLAADRAAEVQAMVRQNWLLRSLRRAPAQPVAAAPAAADGLCCQTCSCAAA